MSQSKRDKLKQQMIDDLDLHDLYRVPVYICELIELLLDRGWKK